MLNQTIKNIILGIIILALLAGAFLVYRSKYPGTGNGPVASPTPSKTVNKLPESENIASILDDLKKNHPEFTSSQIDFYRETARNPESFVDPCRTRDDKDICIASVAFIKSQSDICGEIDNQETRDACAKVILEKMDMGPINKCWVVEDGHGAAINCIKGIFIVYKKQEECSVIISQEVRQVCEGTFYYDVAFLSRTAELCKKITNEKLYQYCLDVISPDTDKDGLSDTEEAKYGTNPKNPDTDSDGFKDGDEVKNGYNPLGAGKLKR
jgi:hypothetical protein